MNDHSARIWDAESGKELRRLVGHTQVIGSAAFSPDGKKVVTASWDQTARIWDAESGRELQRFGGHSGFVTSACTTTIGCTHAILRLRLC